jgi:hypothetical protein
MASGATLTITGGTDMQEVVAGTDLVEDGDYNNARTNINALLGAPVDIGLGGFTLSSTFGWGQGGSGEGAASVGGTILASGANGAFKDLQDEVQEMQTFTGQTSESVTDVAGPPSASTILASDWNTLMRAVQDVWDGRFGHTPSASVTDGSATFTTAWTNNITNETTYTFANETDCRAFFNGGGRVGLSFTRTGGSSNDQNTRWTETCTQIGDILIRYDSAEASGAAPGTVSGVGFYDLTTSYQQILQKFTSTAPYTGDNVVVEAKINSTTNPTVITFRTTMTDAGDGVVDESADGTFTFNARRRQPDTAGTTYSFATPTDSVGTITGS